MSLPRSDHHLVRMHAIINMMHLARPPACVVHGDYRVRHRRVTVVRGDPQLWGLTLIAMNLCCILAIILAAHGVLAYLGILMRRVITNE